MSPADLISASAASSLRPAPRRVAPAASPAPPAAPSLARSPTLHPALHAALPVQLVAPVPRRSRRPDPISLGRPSPSTTCRTAVPDPRTAVPPRTAFASLFTSNTMFDSPSHLEAVNRAHSPPAMMDHVHPLLQPASSAVPSSDLSPIASPSTVGLTPLHPPAPNRSPSYQSALSPCYVHNHLDHSLNETVRRDEDAKKKMKRERRLATLEQEAATDESDSTSGDEDQNNSLTRQLTETATSVREMSKQLGRAQVKSHVQSILIVTKARDNNLIKLTRELALWLMQTPRNGRDRGITVYVDTQLRKSKRFDAEGMEREFPELFRPSHRRKSFSSSSLSSSQTFEGLKRTAMPGLQPLQDNSPKVSSESVRKTSGDEGQLRYWTNEMCSKSPHLFDYVVTLGGDGTVLYASWLFQKVVPPIVPFALGSLGFLTNFDFAKYAAVLNNTIDNGIRVNLRMRFTCTVYRAIEGEENKRRRAVRSGKTGGIFMKSLADDGWESIESGGTREREAECRSAKGKDKEIRCFMTKAVESFEVLNDLVVDRGPSPYVSLLELFCDEHHMTTVQADGLTVSTPTGSTAYSLSAGGSLVHPEIPALLLTPICAHSLSFRPMLLPDSVELRICVPFNSRSTAWASFDGRGRVELRQGDHIKVTASAYPFPTVCADKQSNDWFHSISRTLRWNERKKQSSFVILEQGNKKSRTASEDAGEDRPSTTAERAQEDFGDEEDEEDEEEYLDDEELEQEGYDIDDLSSENPTQQSSPVVTPADPPSRVPTLSRPPSTDNHLTTRAKLQDEQDRFQGPQPKPRRLSARHSQAPVAIHLDDNLNPVITSVPPSTVNGHRSGLVSNSSTAHTLSAATARRRERGEEGDRDFINEPLEVKRGVGGTGRRKALQRGPPTPLEGIKFGGGDFAFAVVGDDVFSDASQTDDE